MAAGLDNLIIYVSSLGVQRAGINKSILLAASELANVGLNPIFVPAGLMPSVFAIRRNAFTGRSAVLFNGIGLGFRYGTLANMIATSVAGRPVFVYWHEDRWVHDRLMRERPHRGRIFGRFITRPNVRHLVTSERAKRFCASLGVNEENIHVVGECVPVPDEQQSLPQSFCQDGRLTVMAVGSIQERKGTDIFCEAAIKVCRTIPNVDFFWFGDRLNFEPGFYERCLAMVSVSGLDHRIRFCGFVDKPALFMANCDILVVTSRDDPLPLSGLEAMSLARTVVTFDVGGLPEAMAGCGYVLGPPDAGDLANKIIELASRDRYSLVREDARVRVREHYSPAAFARKLELAIRKSQEMLQ